VTLKTQREEGRQTGRNNGF